MKRKTLIGTGLAFGCALALASGSASAQCVKKGAIATAGSESSAKWYVMETMVQAVSWGLWPAYVANGSVPGYQVKGEKYKCKKDGNLVTCRGSASFCKAK